MSCSGNPWLSTPHIDAFHDESIRLTDFHAGPTCAPTRASLLTGHYANSTGVWHTVGGRSLLRRNEVTLADALGRSGYRTGLFGKWHLGDNAPYRPQDRGFDRVVTHGGGGVGQAPDWWGNDYWDDTYLTDGKPVKYGGYCTDVWFDLAEEFIRDSAQEPFFCYLAPNAPHEPFNITDEWRKPYRGRLDLTPPESLRRERFYGMISHLDHRFGRLRRSLSELDLEDNTILIFMTDNGTACGASFNGDGSLKNGWNAGLRGVKNSEYDGGHRVPVFIRWPQAGIEGGRAVENVTATVDMMPTLLDLCHVDHDLSFHGESLRPLLESTADSWPERILVTDSQRVPTPLKWRQSAVMTDRWRLVNGRELYDIIEDRGQMLDLAASYPEVVDGLREAYDQWWTLVQPDFDGSIPIPIGADDEPVLLSSHDWRGPEGQMVWHQGQVRHGELRNGYWELEVVAHGTYEFLLYRWPEESLGLSMTAALPEGDSNWNPEVVEDACRWWYEGSKALPVDSAELSLDFDDHPVRIHRYSSIENTAQHVRFAVEMPSGMARLRTLLKLEESSDSEDGRHLGAYYVKVTMIQRSA